MSSELLGSAHNVLKGNLGGAWDINKGYADAYTDLGIARRFGGSAAAYSLRDIGAMNGRVVKARRSEDDLEEDFSASQVASGALEDWVNGKLENTLPADVATAAAAYSLRKVKANYSDDAVRIRRRADDAEVNVAFDSDDKVSSSSSISTVSGSTTATDLNGFLNEVLTVGVAVEGGESASARPDSFTNATNSSFTASVTEVAGGYFPYRTNLNDVIVVSFDIVLTGGATPSLTTSDGVNTTQNRSNSVIINSSGSYTETLTCDQNSGIATHIRFADSDDGTFAVTNFRVVSHTHSAFVHTWYDQAGSNDAVQETAANQPQIAENGALLADGIDFDGTNDLLGLTSALGATTTQSIFFVQKNDVTTGGTLLFDNRDANDDGSAIFATDTAGNKQASWDAADAEHTATTNEELISLIKTSSAIKIIANAVERDSTASSSTIDISNAPKIGASFSSSNHYDGSIKELICYNSDQSDNRFKIESNINNYYGLYNDANELTEDFEGGSISASSVSGQTFVANGKNGFTVTTSSSATGEGGFTTVANVLAYKISFNAKLNGNSVNIGRRTNKHSSGAATQLQALTEGFNTYDYASAGGGSYQALTFTCSDNNATFTISDFKISGIARNGLVETWYDQSGNGNDATQATAANQPAIVQNGGLSSDGLFFDGSNDSFEATDITDVNFPATVVSVSETNSTGTNRALYSLNNDSNACGGFYRSTNKYAINNGTTTLAGSETYTTGVHRLKFDLFNSASSAGFSNSVLDISGDIGTQVSQVTHFRIAGSLKTGITTPHSGTIKEIILYTSDKSSDRTDIETEINNHYNIY